MFWTVAIAIVVTLELIRIALSAYVLLHILEGKAFRRAGDTELQFRRGMATAKIRSRREIAVGPTLDALRRAMDDVAAGRPSAGVRDAIDALGNYALQIDQERRI